ncbi:MAG TPA: hypothetical protein VHX65_07865 [Pirellulales bacterium]|nr:hypothetical protein [Pirellulales bacterium]
MVGIVLSLAFLFLSQGHWEASVFADLSLFVVATAMPFGAMYIFGLRLTNTAGTRKPVDGDVESRLNQFSLRQLFGWIGACALVAGVARFANVEWRDWASFTVFGGAFSLVAVGASLAALLPGRSETVLLRLFLLGVSTIAVVGGFAILELGRFANVGDVMYIAFMGLEHTALITIALLLYRRIGYRLERQRSTGRLRLPVAHEAVAHDAVAHDATTPRD